MEAATVKSVAQRVRTFPWETTPLGPLRDWPLRWRAALDLCLDAGFPTLVWLGPELIQFYNEAAVAILRDKHPRVLGIPARRAWVEAWPVVGALVDSVLRTGVPVRGDDLRVAVERDGRLEEAWFTFSYSALRDDAGDIDGVLVTALETTESVREEMARTTTERRLQAVTSGTQLEAQFRALFEGSPTPTVLLDAEGFAVLAVNAAYLRSSHRRREELLGRNLCDVFPNTSDEIGEERKRSLRHSLFRAVQTRTPDTIGLQRYPVQLAREQGGGCEDRWWTAVNIPVPGPDGSAALIIHRAEDVTETVRLRHDSAAQDRLAREQRELIARIRESEERYRTLFESIDEGFCVVEILHDGDGSPCDYRFLEVNPAFARQTGLSDVVGKTVLSLLPDLERFWIEVYGEVARSGHPVRFERDTTSLRRDYDVYACRVGAPSENRVAMLFSDVTQARRTEAELRATQQRLEEALATAHMAWWRWDARTDTGTASSTLAEVYGLRKGQAIRGAADAQALLHPDDRDRRSALIARAVAQGEGWHDEFRIIRPRDGQLAWLEERATVLPDTASGETMTTGLLWDVTARKQAEVALLDADRRKNEFLATLAHELRNPLAPLRNGLQLARLASTTDLPLEPVVAMMERQLKHLVRLVDDLLDLGRISAGKLELRREPLRLADAIEASAEGARATLEEHGHTFELDLPSRDEIWVEGDHDRLTQVFANLLSNAAKYTPQRGRIVMRLRATPDRASVEVSDTGIGIDAGDLARVFDLFSQVRTHQGHAEGGLGIGLALVRNLVQMHGGEVVAHSAGLGHGSTFTVRLPRVHAPTTAAAATDTATGPSTPCRLLIADDNVDAARSLATLLRLDGHVVEVAHDGAEALELARTFDPAVVILDLGMPVMDGFETARRIRQLPGGERMRLFALTGWGQEDDRRRTQEAGFDAHLVKPLDPEELAALLREQGTPDG